MSGSKNDQLRIRKIKRNLKEAEASPGYGIQLMTKNGENWKSMNGRRLLDSYLNEVIFHNSGKSISNKRLTEETHPFSMAVMFHYVIYTYKQALRIEGAVRIRNDI